MKACNTLLARFYLPTRWYESHRVMEAESSGILRLLFTHHTEENHAERIPGANNLRFLGTACVPIPNQTRLSKCYGGQHVFCNIQDAFESNGYSPACHATLASATGERQESLTTMLNTD